MDSTMFDPPVDNKTQTVTERLGHVNELLKTEAGRSQVLRAIATFLLD